VDRFLKRARRAILGRALLKRCLASASLVTTKRKPFDVLAERPLFEKSRANWRSFEPALRGFADEFTQPVLHLPRLEVFIARPA